MVGRQLTNTNSDGYYRVFINGRGYSLARLAWYISNGAWPIEEIDHINRNRIDNRLTNLREVSRAENARNVWKSANTTGVANIYWCKRERKYLKYTRLPTGKRKYLVSFVFNVGVNAFAKSTMLNVLNLGNYDEAARQFDRWVIPPEITKRRMSEKKQFQT